MSAFRVSASLGDWSRALRGWVVDHDASIDVVLVRDRFAVTAADADVACLDVGLAWVDRALLARLRDRGVPVVGVYGSVEEESLWVEWGVLDRMSKSLDPERMAFLLSRLRPAAPTSPRGPALHRAVAQQTERLPLVFGGPPGAGAREVALSAAATLAASLPTVVVDVNELGDGVARRLGYSVTPNVLTAAQTVEDGGSLSDALAAPLLRRRTAFDVIAGLPSASEWAQWTPTQASAVVRAARSQWPSVVVATSPLVEDLRRWGDRFAVSRTLLGSIDVRVVGVVEASPRGLLRFADWFADADPLHPLAVIVNKTPPWQPSAPAEIRDRLVALVGEERIEMIGTLPFDPRVIRAEWNAELPHRGRFARAVQRLASTWRELTVREVGVPM